MKVKFTPEKPEVISFRTIRRSIGILGIGLPFALLIVSYLGGCRQIQPTISHYFYTVAGSLLVGVLCGVGLFLITYKGFPPLDNFVTNLAGILAFGIAFFPTGEFVGSSCRIVLYPQSMLRSIIHYGCAALFFIALAYISYFLFTRTDGNVTPEKMVRNKIYRTCGILIMISIAVIPIISFTALDQMLQPYNPVFCLEALALVTFGISWLVKGEVVLEDK